MPPSLSEVARLARKEMRGHIPNYLGYEAKENRKETDRGLREHLASEIAGIQQKFENLITGLVLAERPQIRKVVAKMVKRMQLISESLKLSDYRNTALWESEYIDEHFLGKMYQHDLSLERKIDALNEEVDSLAEEGIEEEQIKECLNRVIDQIDGFNQEFSEREFLIFCGGKEEL